jgi:hypothetical protein
MAPNNPTEVADRRRRSRSAEDFSQALTTAQRYFDMPASARDRALCSSGSESPDTARHDAVPNGFARGSPSALLMSKAPATESFSAIFPALPRPCASGRRLGNRRRAGPGPARGSERDSFRWCPYIADHDAALFGRDAKRPYSPSNPKSPEARRVVTHDALNILGEALPRLGVNIERERDRRSASAIQLA